MPIQYIRIPIDTNLKSYLKDAEAAVDALSDEELPEAEAALEARIHALADPPIPIFSRSKAAWKKASLISILMAASVLFFISNPFDQGNHQQSKGLSEASVCEVTVIQNSQESVLDSDGAYLVSETAWIYVRANCLDELMLERFENGKWTRLQRVQLYRNFVVTADGPLDFRKYLGQILRLRAENGLSVEFSLKKTP